MPEKLMRCYTQVKAQLSSKNPNWKPERIDRVARAICVKKTGMTFQHGMAAESFNVSFSESGKVNKFEFRFSTNSSVIDRQKLQTILEAKSKSTNHKKNFMPDDPNAVIVTGTAIYETTSANHHRYSAEELIKAVDSMVGIPCQKDHSFSMKDTFGTVVEAWHEPTGEHAGQITHVSMLDSHDPDSGRVQRNYVRNVSVAGSAERVLCSICGQDLGFNHEHYVGETYDGKVCEADMIGLKFVHLGYTSFPAVENADANFVPVSLDESIDDALAYMETIRSNIGNNEDDCGCSQKTSSDKTKFGESMTNEPNQSNNTLVELEKTKYQLEEAKKKNSELEEAVKAKESLQKELSVIRERERERIVNDIVETETELGKLDKAKANDRKTVLLKETSEVLEAKLQVLRGFLNDARAVKTEQQKTQSKSKTFTTGNAVSEMSEEKKAFYETESKKEKLGAILFGQSPSVSSVKTLQEWDPQMGRWRTDFAELVRRVPKGNRKSQVN